MSDHMRVLLVGPGNMGSEYCKVLQAQGHVPVVVGRGEASAQAFEEKFGISVVTGGVEKALVTIRDLPTHAIVAAPYPELSATAVRLIEAGVRNVLIEKPAGVNIAEVKAIADAAEKAGAHVFVAYNRRFYASVARALEIIAEDGGATSMNFEFTEWSSSCEKAVARYDEAHREVWFVANSTHVVDLAFFLAGEPAELSCYTRGGLSWHKSGCIYAGAGITERNVLFSYQANWAAPGRWGIEVLTAKHRLYLRPMEKLSIQELNSVEVKSVELSDERDRQFKPGLFDQVASFLSDDDDPRKIGIREHLDHMRVYAKIENKATI